ncbi:MAG: hypothetical protein WD553_04370 [Gemmatimonadaceae bacterium]
MLSRLFPRRLDNSYRGYKLALVIFGLVALVRVAIGLGSIFNGYLAASSADGIPLDTFPAAATQTILSLFAMLGLSRLLLGLLCILVLIRYRAMVPLMFAVLLLEQLGRQLIVYFLPIPRVGAPPVSAIHLTILALLILGLALSLLTRKPSTA